MQAIQFKAPKASEPRFEGCCAFAGSLLKPKAADENRFKLEPKPLQGGGDQFVKSAPKQ